jgi:hypothetical protein
MKRLLCTFVVALLVGTCASPPHALRPPVVEIANPLRIDVQHGLAGRYRFDDGAMRIQFDPREVVRTPISFRGSGVSLPAGTYDLYVRVGDDEQRDGTREVEVGLGDAIALLRYELPRGIGWIGPLQLSPTRGADAIEMRGSHEVRFSELWLSPAGQAAPMRATAVRTLAPSSWATIWIDLPDRVHLPWFTAQQPVTVRARVGGPRASSTATVICEVLDFYHHVVGTHEIEVAFDGRRERLIEVPVPAKYGRTCCVVERALRPTCPRNSNSRSRGCHLHRRAARTCSAPTATRR